MSLFLYVACRFRCYSRISCIIWLVYRRAPSQTKGNRFSRIIISSSIVIRLWPHSNISDTWVKIRKYMTPGPCVKNDFVPSDLYLKTLTRYSYIKHSIHFGSIGKSYQLLLSLTLFATFIPWSYLIGIRTFGLDKISMGIEFLCN